MYRSGAWRGRTRSAELFGPRPQIAYSATSFILAWRPATARRTINRPPSSASTSPHDEPDPRQWAPKGAPPPDEPVNVEAVVLAIDQYLVALSDEEFAALVARVRNGQQQTSQY